MVAMDHQVGVIRSSLLEVGEIGSQVLEVFEFFNRPSDDLGRLRRKLLLLLSIESAIAFEK